MVFNKITTCLFLAFNLLPLADVVYAETLPACSGFQITESCSATPTTLENKTLNTYTVADGAEMQFSGLTVSGDSGGAFHLGNGSTLEIIPENTSGYSEFTGNSSSGNGGAIFAKENSTVYLENTLFIDNVAHDYGGAIYMYGSNDEGDVDLTITNAVFSGNIASEGKGGAIYSLNNKVQLTNILFENNQAKTNGNGSNGNGSGGAIDATDNTTDSHGSMFITNSEFTGNQAEGQGGAIYTNSASTPFFVDINIDENYEDNNGVAYYHDNVADNYGNDPDAAGGGFMYLGHSEANFDIAADKTLVIGNTANDGAYDSIAGYGAIFKRGAGELVLNADNSGFTGVFDILEGTVTLGRDDTLVNVGDTNCQSEADTCHGIVLGNANSMNDKAILNVGSTQQTFKNAFMGHENSTLNIDAGGNVIVNSGYMAGTTTGAGDLTVAENGSFTLTGAQSMGLDGDIVVEQNAVLSVQGDAEDLAILQADPQSIVLDGGVLDLSDMSTFNGQTNQVNDGLTITGTGGTVIGNDDLVTLGAGTDYHIGDGTSAADGVYVVIDAGDGRVTLADNNAYLGTTQIASGTLQITDNSQLGDKAYNRQVIFTDPAQASTLEVSAPADGSGQVDTTSAQTGKARDIEMRASGTMQVDDGVTTQWGGLMADSTGAQADVNSTFTKTGNGTLILDGTGSSHSAVRVEQGTLQGGAENIIASASSLYVGDNATFETGLDQQVQSLDVASGGTIVISDDTQLMLMEQDTSAALDASLFADTDGTLVNATSGMSLQGTLNTNMTLDALTYLPGVTVNGSLDNSAGTASLQNGTAGDTLTVNGDYTGGGTVVLETEMNGDTSATDQLILNGNTSGDTALAIVPVSGIGQATQAGIKVVDFVADPQGNNNAADFHLAGDQQYINMGAYDYSLVQDNQDWYLRSQVVTPDPQPEPVPGGDDFTPVLNPKMGSYMNNLRIANNVFSMTAQDHAGADHDNLKLRVDTARDSATFGNQIDSHNDTSVAQLSANFLQHPAGNGELLAGIVAGYSNNSGDSTSVLTGRKSDNDSQGYAVGLTGAWYQDAQAHQGAYLDSWLQYAWFDNSVSEEDTGDDNYHASGLLASLEGGYRFTLMQGNQWNWTLQPQAQVIYQGVKQKDFTSASQSKVTQTGDDNIQTRLGLRSEWDIHPVSTLHIKPFVEANYRHNSEQTSLNVDGVNFTDNTAKDSAELSTGISGNLGANTTVWGKVGQQEGSDDFSQTEATVGVSVRW
ncbi:putative transporter ATP-binding component [Rahnella aquatilis CIP 78.65 = ATCC 33071]|uniref:Outer membrane autotransporter barrel domain-containing protein n=1 Tax=Rahnella aquatilis (strain ATCC 33071 / DSM 4594 / JCM 1683 / NBRC 105701 / NCIMB 13365 / CIP 78.65) TaxID=745277 RepID=H2IPS6_RAHAC|nr:outer membrane autotransporter barrel domain-containing protein [Rahnella aquatilis CIP 78.65 = ATCC 33071]KFD17716.1 putative transporter ATP-binding component [Rahnella aquatilis CIP 78.65 = ATCC 33071]